MADEPAKTEQNQPVTGVSSADTKAQDAAFSAAESADAAPGKAQGPFSSSQDLDALVRELAAGRERLAKAKLEVEAALAERAAIAEARAAAEARAEKYRQFALKHVRAQYESAPPFVRERVAVTDESDPVEVAAKIAELVGVFEAAKASLAGAASTKPEQARRLPTIDR